MRIYIYIYVYVIHIPSTYVSAIDHGGLPLPADLAMAVGHEALLGRCGRGLAAGCTECAQGLQQSSVTASSKAAELLGGLMGLLWFDMGLYGFSMSFLWF